MVKDDAYLQQTSDVTPPRWRASAVQQLSKHFPTRAFFGKPFLGKTGYNLPAFLRIVIRSPKQTAVLHRVEAAVRRVPDGAHPMGTLANAAVISDSAISPAAYNSDSNENNSRPEVCTATEMNEMKKNLSSKHMKLVH
ncbi:hypothetical protein PF007_g32847 [Phytophthora fragariae]|uniref:Uncharacterized protein n=2 Tax=Phytophthora fragariae TaxID=53985 RepID=A0A6A3PFG5_9STRA|nr:hypothetical protein PF007_g32847 [Phytophthora fragariae]